MESTDLRKAGLKVTHPRMRILEILDTHDGKHMTAEDIYRRLLEHHDDIGLAGCLDCLLLQEILRRSPFERQPGACDAAGLYILNAEVVRACVGKRNREMLDGSVISA